MADFPFHAIVGAGDPFLDMAVKKIQLRGDITGLNQNL